MVYKKDSFKDEKFHLYPTKEIYSNTQIKQPQTQPSVRKCEIIAGNELKIKIEQKTVNNILHVFFEDITGGTSRLKLQWQNTHGKTGYANPILYPSESLKNNSNYNWSNEQEIAEIRFI